MKKSTLYGLCLLLSVGLTSCGPKAFTKGEYDDPTRVALLDDRFNEADMQTMAKTAVDGILECSYMKKNKRPVVVVDRIQNRTEEHIDMKSFSDKIRVALIKSGKVRFINKKQRGTLDEEYDRSKKGYTSKKSSKAKGKQLGADYVFGGDLATNIQQVGNDKLIYYKLTVNMTNVDTSVIDCTEEREVRKKYRKRSVGL